MAAASENTTEQLRKMAKTPFEGLQAAITSDLSDNVNSLVTSFNDLSSDIRVHISEQKDTNATHKTGISDNKKAVAKNADKIIEMRISDVKTVAVITGVSGVVGGGIVVLANLFI